MGDLGGGSALHLDLQTHSKPSWQTAPPDSPFSNAGSPAFEPEELNRALGQPAVQAQRRLPIAPHVVPVRLSLHPSDLPGHKPHDCDRQKVALHQTQVLRFLPFVE
jgi:hypothetical protein